MQLKMNLQKLIEANNQFAQEMEKNAQERGVCRVIDGVINPERYVKSSPRVLWILKEANSVDLSWSIVDNFKDKNWLETYGRSNPTIRKIIYTSYAILNEVAWSEIPYGNEPQAYDCLQDVAFINLKKEPGDHQAEYDAVQSAYNQDKDLIHRQIQAFDPEVIIFGNTLQYFDQSLLEGFSSEKRQNTELGNAYYPTEKRLYIWSWHPASRVTSEENYVMDIAQIVRNWKK